jgi:hypothetical protein
MEVKGRRMKSYLYYSIGIYIMHKEVFRGQEKWADKIYIIIN